MAGPKNSKKKSGVSPLAITVGVCVAVVALGVIFFFTEDARPVRPRGGPNQPGAAGPADEDPNAEKYEELCKAGEALVENEQFAEAQKLYDEAVALNPVHPLAHFNLGRVSCLCHFSQVFLYFGCVSFSL